MTLEQNNLLPGKSILEVKEEMDSMWLRNDWLGRMMFVISLFTFLPFFFYTAFKYPRMARGDAIIVFPFSIVIYYIFDTIFFIVKHVVYTISVYFEMSLSEIEYKNISRNVTLLLMIPGYFISFYVLTAIILPSFLKTVHTTWIPGKL
ncbi:MAG: hypothetical protein LBS53_13370 [Synergistaceae bacterium]|jgi:hypothetical protein|nr:hypothetical protein [Synergistaceae bacterium]